MSFLSSVMKNNADNLIFQMNSYPNYKICPFYDFKRQAKAIITILY